MLANLVRIQERIAVKLTVLTVEDSYFMAVVAMTGSVFAKESSLGALGPGSLWIQDVDIITITSPRFHVLSFLL